MGASTEKHMTLTARLLMICGALLYLAGPLALHLPSVPVRGWVRGDVMIAMFIVGSLLVVVGLTMWHRQHLRRKQAAAPVTPSGHRSLEQR